VDALYWEKKGDRIRSRNIEIHGDSLISLNWPFKAEISSARSWSIYPEIHSSGESIEAKRPNQGKQAVVLYSIVL
jgi:hypothetical protein